MKFRSDPAQSPRCRNGLSVQLFPPLHSGLPSFGSTAKLVSVASRSPTNENHGGAGLNRSTPDCFLAWFNPCTQTLLFEGMSIPVSIAAVNARTQFLSNVLANHVREIENWHSQQRNADVLQDFFFCDFKHNSKHLREALRKGFENEIVSAASATKPSGGHRPFSNQMI